MEASKKELEQAWVTINDLRDNEQTLTGEIETLRGSIVEMEDKLRDKEMLSSQPKEDVGDLIEEKASLMHKLSESTEAVLELRKELGRIPAALKPFIRMLNGFLLLTYPLEVVIRTRIPSIYCCWLHHAFIMV